MLRKILNIIIVFLFLVTTTGVTISTHYCASNLISVSIDSSSNNCCSNNSRNNCHNDIKQFHLANIFIPVFIQFNYNKSIVTYEFTYNTFFNSLLIFNKKYYNVLKSLPLYTADTLTSELQSFLL